MRLLQCMRLLIVRDTQSRGIKLAYTQPTSELNPSPLRRRSARMEEALQAVDACFGRFCLTAGIEALHAMMAGDVEDLCR